MSDAIRNLGADQLSLFQPANVAPSVQIPPAPTRLPHTWPYPGMTPITSAQSSMAGSAEYHEMLAAVIKLTGGHNLTTAQVLALVPQDWRDLCGKFAHGNVANWCAEKHDIAISYVSHDGGGFHFAYQAQEERVAA